jgi:hypothetical protein
METLSLGVGVKGVDQLQLVLWSHTVCRPLTVYYHISNPPLCKCKYSRECSCMADMSTALGKFGLPGVKFKLKWSTSHCDEEECHDGYMVH